MAGRSSIRRVFALALVLTAACNSADDVLAPGSDGRDAERIAAVAARLQDSPLALPAAHLAVQAWPQALTCPATFDLGDGATGTCTELQFPGYYYSSPYTAYRLDTSATVPGGSTHLDFAFQMMVTPNSDRSEYSVSVSSASANVSQGSGVWSLVGAAYVDAVGNTVDLRMYLTTSRGRWRVLQDEVLFSDVRSPDVTARVHYASGSGTIQLGGTVVANLAVQGGCVTVDYVDPATTDETTCMW